MEELLTSTFGQWTANTVAADASQISIYVESNLSGIADEVSAKIQFNDQISGISGVYKSLTIDKLDEAAFELSVVNKGNFLSDHIYVVSSDNLNMFGEEIINVGAPTSSDSAATKNMSTQQSLQYYLRHHL